MGNLLPKRKPLVSSKRCPAGLFATAIQGMPPLQCAHDRGSSLLRAGLSYSETRQRMNVRHSVACLSLERLPGPGLTGTVPDGLEEETRQILPS